MREIPYSKSAEAGVLGSMMIEPQRIDSVLEIIKEPDDFYLTENKEIFKAIIRLYEQNKSGGNRGLDAILVRDELEKYEMLEKIGGVEYIAEVLESVPSSANIIYYAEILRDKRILRDLIVTGTHIVENAFDESGDAKEKLDSAERELFKITGKEVSSDFTKIGESIEKTYLELANRESQYITGLETGYYKLDEMLCGLQDGEMIILAGRPSMGKTSLAMNIAEHIGLNNTTPIGILSLEMSTQRLSEKFLCTTSEIDQQFAKRGILGIKHFEKMLETANRYAKAEIYIDDSSTLSPLQFRAKARRLKRQFKVQCIIIDYLQLMSTAKRIESRQQEITEISRYIKALAKELDIPILVLSQLNRSPESRADHRPRMSDLRESGSLEQDADVVMLIHREDYYHRADADYEPDRKAEIIIAKQRNGPTGSVDLIFREKLTRFENASRA